MVPEERSNYVKLLRKIVKNKNIKNDLEEVCSVQRLCRCLAAILQTEGFEDLCKKKNPESSQKLCNLIRRHKSTCKSLIRFSSKKKDINEKKKILQSGGFPIASIIGLALPVLLSLIRRK